jgi:Zn-dependent protease
MLDTNVRVHPSFWIVMALLGWGFFNRLGFSYLLLWVLCCFLSVLLHEFGHIMMGRCFGRKGHIVLFSFGGLAIGIDVWKHWQRILVSFAGPAIQLVLLGVIVLIQMSLHPEEQGLEEIAAPIAMKPLDIMLGMLFWINLVWPVFNLLPIWPLDGGQIAREVCQMIWRQSGLSYSLLLSGVVAGVLALHCLMGEQGKRLIPFLPVFGGIFTAIFLAMFAIQSFQAWQIESNRRRGGRHDRLPWE